MNNNKAIKIAVYTAILSCLAFILNAIGLPYIIAPWLKIDFSEVMTLIGTTISVYIGLFVALIKGFLMTMTGTSSGFIGEITLVIGSLIIVFVFWFTNKILKLNTIISLIIMGICFTITMTVLNYFIITPFFFNQTYEQLANSNQVISLFGYEYTFTYLQYILIVYVPYNLVKITLDSLIYYFVYKKLKAVLGDKINGN